MAELDEVVRARRAVRGFHRDRPVEPHLVREALELAQRAPSNCNVQPWRVTVLSGEAVERVRTALTGAIDAGDFGDAEDPIDTFPGDYRPLQIACAVELYGHMGIERQDGAGRLRALRRNFELFDAPHLAVVCMEKHFGLGVALDVGMWVQTFLLALTERGIGSCAQAALRNYPTLLRRELGLPDSLRVLCGVSFGYEDEAVPANRTRLGREPLDKNVRFVDA
jgi:nitroreductase